MGHTEYHVTVWPDEKAGVLRVKTGRPEDYGKEVTVTHEFQMGDIRSTWHLCGLNYDRAQMQILAQKMWQKLAEGQDLAATPEKN